jgi:CDP-diacylglycerol--serine O-phosphatidyltransferase
MARFLCRCFKSNIAAMKIKAIIPNLFTLGNLICGSYVALDVARNGHVNFVVILLFVAGFLDLLDGAVARALKVSGEMGKQLDSLADVVSFGLAPSVIIFSMLEVALPYDLQWIKYLAFLNVACAAWRLAKFNISTDQTTDFTGMPSPANGLFWASIALLLWKMNSTAGMVPSSSAMTYTLVLLILTSYLMVSPIKMFSFKFKPGGFQANRFPFLYIGMIVVLPIVILVTGRPFLMAIPTAILLYMAMSFAYHFSKK